MDSQELERQADALLRASAREHGILLDPHLRARLRREVYVQTGKPDPANEGNYYRAG